MVAVTSDVDANGDPVWGPKQNITELPEGETNVAIENLRAGRRYWVRMWNEDQFGNKSPYREQVVDTPSDSSIPATPTGFELTPASFGFRANWDANEELDLAEYEVSVAPDDGSHTQPSADLADVVYTRVKTTTHWFEGEIGVTYWVRIRAIDTSGNMSPWSDFATVTPFWLVPLLFGSTGVFDTDSPMYCFMSVPDSVSAITQATLKLAFRQFSANSRDSASSGTLTSNTDGGSTTPSGGGSTSGSSSSSTTGTGDHKHIIAGDLGSAGGYTLRKWIGNGLNFDLAVDSVPGDSRIWTFLESESGTEHDHGMSHTHTTPSHTHTTPNHDHTVPGHTHAMTYGTFEESFPASHSVTVKTYKLIGSTWTLQDTVSGLTLNNETVDLTGVIDGPGDWRIQVQSAAAQPNNGRLGVDMYGNITAVIGGSGIFDGVITPDDTFIRGALWVGGVEVIDEDGNLLVGAPPGGAAGGDLSGTYPNPSVVDDSHAHSSTSVTTHSTAHAHSSLTGIGTDDHHAKSHVHNADGSGTVAHSSLSGISATDHHVPPAAGPDSDITIDAAGAAGAPSTFARSGHGHKVATDSGVASTQAFGDAATAGTSGTIQRAGHKHAMPADPVPAHEAAVDPHTGYRLESADHSHATTGLQGGTVAHSVLTGIGADDHHARSHDHSAAGDGTALVPASIDVSAGNVTIHDTASNGRLVIDDHAYILITTDGAHVLLVGPDGTTSNFPYRMANDGQQEWGSGAAARDLRLRRSGAKTMTIDDNAGGSATVNVVGTLQQGGTGVELVNGATAGPDADITIDAAGAAGTASTHARSAHGHKLSTSASNPVALGAAAPGTSGHSPSRDDHVHPTTGLSLTGHGAADHTDITRKLWLNAATGKLSDTVPATAANIGAAPDLTEVVAYADAATQGAIWNFMVPADWASGVITIQPVWSPGATDGVAHTVRWSYIAKAVAAGSTVTAAGTTTTWTGASAARTVGVVVYDTATSTGITPAAAGDAFRIMVRRIGADAADTYVGVVNLIGLIVSYTANQ
jgi:hypothetical protein